MNRQYFFQHPIISGIIPIDNQEFIEKLNSMELQEGKKVNETPLIFVKYMQEEGTVIILSGFTIKFFNKSFEPSKELVKKSDAKSIIKHEFGGQKFNACPRCFMRVDKDNCYCRHCGQRLR